jgi:hypothetical protein
MPDQLQFLYKRIFIFLEREERRIEERRKKRKEKIYIVPQGTWVAEGNFSLHVFLALIFFFFFCILRFNV